MKASKSILLLSLSSLFALNVGAAAYKGQNSTAGKGPGDPGQLAAGCSPATASTELNINNTRALIQSGGDMWWDLIGQARYEIPKDSKKTSLFAGSLWLGGQDVSGQLKVAALRFRSNGNDYWTGPLSTKTSEIDAATCNDYDTQWLTTRDEVSLFNSWFSAGIFDAENGTTTQSDNFGDYTIPSKFYEWPAQGRDFEPYNEDTYLAPFFDRNGDGVYNPADGDYPAYDLDGSADCKEKITNIYGDQNIWWVFNDKGNIHTETGAASIGMEIRAQAFAFATNDEVNNMTFYNYELHNRSSYTLTETYFGQWVDADLGNAQDDYVGCDVTRGLGYSYNGDENDEDNGGAIGYGSQPPAIGVDFFQGPFQDPDGKDNCLCTNYSDAISDDGIVYNGSGVGYGDAIIDNERLGMRAFLYHNNNNTVTGDPVTGVQYYNYLRSIWRDNSKMVYGGTGHISSPAANPNVTADFMFPDDTDTLGWGTGGVKQTIWNEVTAGNTPFDRRFMQSAGAFTLAPGAVNNITVGVVWARATSGGAFASVQTLRKADDKTQALFDNCFKVLNGPDAPELSIQEMDKSLILFIENSAASNNYNEKYQEVDPFIIAPDSLTQQEKIEYASYKFQGYIIYQVKNSSVSTADLDDPDLSRVVAQCDVKDGVTTLINYEFDEALGGNIPTLKVSGADLGVKNSFKITDDQFATGTKTLVNHKKYYFIAIAYAYNQFKKYDPLSAENLDGQTKPFLGSRKSAIGAIKIATAIPHNTNVENGGTILNSQYGDGVPVVRIEGTGNGANFLDMEVSSREEALLAPDFKVKNPVYKAGFAPIEVKVVDPLNVKGGDYSIAFRNSTNSNNLNEATWVLYGGALEDTIYSSSTIQVRKEQLALDLGISITVEQAQRPGYVTLNNNGVIGAELSFEDARLPWLSGIPDADGSGAQNWIRAGAAKDDNAPENNDKYMGGTADAVFIDKDEYFEKMLGGTWAPFRFAANAEHGPMDKLKDSRIYFPLALDSSMHFLNGVDIVFTSDKSKWTRSPVIEMQDTVGLSVGGAKKNFLRKSPSVDKDGNVDTTSTSASTDENSPNFISTYGMGWFPGYAVDIETGERLNIAFGEDSWLQAENGADMLWNPTSNIVSGGPFQDVRFGGKHYIYVFRNNVVEEEKYTSSNYMEYNDMSNRGTAYDYGKYIFDQLNADTDKGFRNAWRPCMWVGLPLVDNNYGLLSTTATIKLRVNKAYEKYGTNSYISANQQLELGKRYMVVQGPILYNSIEYKRGSVFTASSTTSFIATTTDNIDNVVEVTNEGLPMYSFNLDDLAASIQNDSVASSALDDINVVPNPYYAYSEYETSKLDNRIKITNLPQTCTITIYTVNGNIIRQFQKDDPTITSVDWDLKNTASIPVSSGIYVIHVSADGIGEKVIKWMGVMRPVDLDSF